MHRKHRLVKTATALAVVAALSLLVVTSSASAAEGALPVGKADGVRIERIRGELVVTFTKRAARLYRKVAGKVISVYCTELELDEDGGALGLSATSSGGGSVRAPKKRRPIHTGDLTTGLDYCRVWLAERTVGRGRKRRHYGRELIVSVPLTQKGAVRLDEESKAFDLFVVLIFASGLAERRDSKDFSLAAEVIAEIGGRDGPAHHRIVELATPSDTPPAGSIGYYSDGQAHAAAVILSASGRRLLIEFEPDGVLRTNVAGYIYGDLDY